MLQMLSLNSSSLGQNGHHLTDNIFKRIFFNEKVWFLINNSLKFVPKSPFDNNLPSVYGLVPNRRQAIIWTNADPIHRWIYVVLGGDELSDWRILPAKMLLVWLHPRSTSQTVNELIIEIFEMIFFSLIMILVIRQDH